MNILICSAGRRVKLVEFFRAELNKINGKVIAVDCDETAPALHYADKYEIVPQITNPDYILHIKKLCYQYEIKGILSLIDPELSLLANFKEEFEREGIQVIVSDKDVVDICFDKFLTSQFLQHNGLPYIPTYISIDEAIQDMDKEKLHFPLIVKPKNGSASIGINKINSINELEIYRNEMENFIIQPFIDGQEFGIDCYIDLLTRKPINIFMKRKLIMRAGETDKSVSIYDPTLKLMIEKLLHLLKPIGPVDIDCFLTEKGYVISEINPRFGGGYPHAFLMGHNFMRNIIKNLNGLVNEPVVEEYEKGTIMVKYENVKLLKSAEKLVNTAHF